MSTTSFETLSEKEKEFLQILEQTTKSLREHQRIEPNLAIAITTLTRKFDSPEIVVGFFVSAARSEQLVNLWELLSDIENMLETYRFPGGRRPRLDPKVGMGQWEFTRIRQEFGF